MTVSGIQRTRHLCEETILQTKTMYPREDWNRMQNVLLVTHGSLHYNDYYSLLQVTIDPIKYKQCGLSLQLRTFEVNGPSNFRNRPKIRGAPDSLRRAPRISGNV